jgi:hypothetical protein
MTETSHLKEVEYVVMNELGLSACLFACMCVRIVFLTSCSR